MKKTKKTAKKNNVTSITKNKKVQKTAIKPEKTYLEERQEKIKEIADQLFEQLDTIKPDKEVRNAVIISAMEKVFEDGDERGFSSGFDWGYDAGFDDIWDDAYSIGHLNGWYDLMEDLASSKMEPPVASAKELKLIKKLRKESVKELKAKK